MDKKYAEYAVEKAFEALSIDSPTGYTKNAALWAKNEFEKLGYKAEMTNKGGVIIDLGGKDESDALFLQAHIDTIGAMVSQIKSDGRLKLTQLGGLHPESITSENVRIHTRSGKVYEGTFQFMNASVHVNDNFDDEKRTYKTTEVVIDEDVKNEEDVRSLGIEVGDIVAFEPRTRLTESGYIKSRFLDDKLLVGILFSFAKYMKDNNLTPERKLYAHITVYEEIGHGGSASVPDGVTEGLSLDMGCVGEGITCTEKQVSICAKDAGGPYNYDMVSKLIEAAKKERADYAVDIYPHYGSDVETTLRAGYDIRHGLIGPGVYASHGYERSHLDGVLNTLKVLTGYVF